MNAGGVGVAAYLLPLPETKKGFSAALSGRGREPVGLLYTYACGAAGSVAGFFGTTAYISSAASRSPLMAGLKTPYALFGAFLGGQLSFHLGPAIVDISRSSAQVVAFTADGFIADTIGRPKVTWITKPHHTIRNHTTPHITTLHYTTLHYTTLQKDDNDNNTS